MVSHNKRRKRLKAFEKRVLRKIFGPRRDEVTGVWKRVHSEELQKFMLHQVL
jgi:hypothetical protein